MKTNFLALGTLATGGAASRFIPVDSMTRLNEALAGRYEVERELGQGGMATVYLARDVRHGRHVAVKMLRPELAAVIGAERFLAEIKTTASLQHPHILPLHDSGEAAGTVFYVMPYVEGESLRDRLKRDKQIPVDEALRITREVASALDYAHRHGVVHRDIKPENILLHEGQALVADFGIALAVSRSEGGTRMTETGMSLGTPHYMAPEQAMGEREISQRVDVYALGCVLYEMLTGDPPFTGSTAQAIVARVVTETPRSMVTQRRTIPAHVEAAVFTALEKLPADRFASAGEFAAALGDPTFASRGTNAARLTAPVPSRTARPATIAGVVALAALAALGAWGWLRPRPATQTTRFEITLPDSAQTVAGISVTPEGNRILFRAGRQTYVRLLADFAPAPLAGVGPGSNLFFMSPDGRELGFNEGGSLKAVPLTGGTARTIVAGAGGFGASWGSDGNVYFGGFAPNGLKSVPAGGGTPEVRVDNTVNVTAFPQLLPGDQVLFTQLTSPRDSGEIRIVDLATKKVTSLGVGWAARYVPPGYLLFARGGYLLAAPIDLKRLQLSAPPVPILEDVGSVPTFAYGGGTLALGTSSQLNALLTPLVVTLSGRKQPFANLPSRRDYGFPRVSPDGKRVAFRVTDEKAQADIWVYTFPAGPLTRLTFGAGAADDPGWTPDGKRISYGASKDGVRRLYVQASDGSDEPTLLLSKASQPWTSEWLPDGKRFLFSNGASAYDIGIASVGAPDTARMLLATPSDERRPSLSPDGRWMAYQSNESGRQEIYARQVDGTGKWQISTEGGFSPRWSRGGRTIFFRNRDSLYAADVVTGTAVSVRGTRGVLNLAGTVDAWYDVLPGDTAFVMLGANVGDGPQRRERIMVITNFLDDLERRFKK
ncbi:MAG: protein kinase [Gemmatimonadaceae bacterium]